MYPRIFPAAAQEAVGRLNCTQDECLIKIQAHRAQAVDATAEEKSLATPWSYETFHLFLEVPSLIARPMNKHRVSNLPPGKPQVIQAYFARSCVDEQAAPRE